MLSQADAALVQRDPQLPGLGLLLNPAAMLDVLQTRIKAEIEAVHPNYLRYKPGTSCLAAYRVKADGQEIDMYAKTYRPNNKAKLGKVRMAEQRPGRLGFGAILLEEIGAAIFDFPNDRHLKGLIGLRKGRPSPYMLTEMLPKQPELSSATLHGLRYKPERRYVVQLATNAGPKAVLKFYTPQDFQRVSHNTQILNRAQDISLAPTLGMSANFGVIATAWQAGYPLNEAVENNQNNQVEAKQMQAVGAALARLHQQELPGLPQRIRPAETLALQAAARSVAAICPALAADANRLARLLGIHLHYSSPLYRPIHGDFSTDQVLLTETGPVLLDFDRIALGDPAADLGSFIAQLESRVLVGAISPMWASTLITELLSGYRQANQGSLPTNVATYTAVGLLQLASQPFRYREPNWSEQIQAMLERIKTYANGGRAPGKSRFFIKNQPSFDLMRSI